MLCYQCTGFINLIGLTMTWYSEKMMISYSCIRGFMPNSHKKSWMISKFTYLFCKKLVPDCSWLETNELRNWWFGLLSYSRSVLNFSLFPRSDQRRILNLNNEAFDTVPVDGSWEWPTYILHNRTELCRAIVIIVIDCSKNKTQPFLLTPFQVKY